MCAGSCQITQERCAWWLAGWFRASRVAAGLLSALRVHRLHFPALAVNPRVTHSLICATAAAATITPFFLQLVVLLVKADTIDVNVAGSKRFTQRDWAAAAEVFERELAGVQLVDEQQVRLDLADCCCFWAGCLRACLADRTAVADSTQTELCKLPAGRVCVC
jgi:hypothetical protein